MHRKHASAEEQKCNSAEVKDNDLRIALPAELLFSTAKRVTRKAAREIVS
jgi:hypothetical protein